MLKRGAVKGSPKVKNKWPEPQSAAAGSVQTQFAIFHKTSKCHRKCLHSGYLFLSLLVHCSSLFQKVAKGVQGAAPKCYKDTKMDPKGAHMAPKGAQMVPKWSPRVPKWAPKVTQSAQRTPKATPKCHYLRWAPSIQQSRHPCLESQRSAAEAVAFSM